MHINDKRYLLISLLLILTGCKAGLENTGNNGGDTNNIDTFIGPENDNRWDLTLNRGSSEFTLEHSIPGNTTPLFTATGNYTEEDSGFMTLEVEEVTGSSSIRVNDELSIIEVDESLIFLNPTAGSAFEQIYPLVSDSTCPTGENSVNWITVDSDQDSSDSNLPIIGNVTLSTSNNSIDLDPGFSLEALPGNAELEEISFNVGISNCADAFIATNDGEFYLTENGLSIIRDTSIDTRTLLTLPSTELNAISDIDSSSNYLGYIDDNGANSGSRVRAISASCSSTSGCELFTINIETEVTEPFGSITWDSTINSPEDGFVNGNISVSGEQGNIACLVNTNLFSRSTIALMCAFQSPSNNSLIANLYLSIVP